MEEIIAKYTTTNWDLLCENENLSEEFIEKYKDLVDWKSIFKYQKLSKNFANKYKNIDK